jgi:hypothetical protein
MLGLVRAGGVELSICGFVDLCKIALLDLINHHMGTIDDWFIVKPLAILVEINQKQKERKLFFAFLLGDEIFDNFRMVVISTVICDIQLWYQQSIIVVINYLSKKPSFELSQ